jgi:hypothetical protein
MGVGIDTGALAMVFLNILAAFVVGNAMESEPGAPGDDDLFDGIAEFEADHRPSTKPELKPVRARRAKRARMEPSPGPTFSLPPPRPSWMPPRPRFR